MQAIETEPLLGDNTGRTGSQRRPPRPWDVRTQFGSAGSGSTGASRHSGEENDDTVDDLTVLQACVFLEDAIWYRSIHHRVSKKSLQLYRAYYSRPAQFFLYAVIFTILILAFFENPSSLSWTSDMRFKASKRVYVPCGLTESIELICLIVLTVDVVLKGYLKGRVEFVRSRWLLAYIFVIFVSLIDWFVTVGYNCGEEVRFRRMLRPFFLLQNSSLMKKTVNCLRRTLPQVVSVLLLLAMHIFFFSLFGLLLFPKEWRQRPIHNATDGLKAVDKTTEQYIYFNNLPDTLMHLLVLLTTANNPDITMPAYSRNRFSALYFIIFLTIGLYCLMNMLTAVIYNQFRGYFLNSMQASLFRRRLGIRAAYEVLRQAPATFPHRSSLNAGLQDVPVTVLQQVILKVKMKSRMKDQIKAELSSRMGCVLTFEQFREIFSVLENDTQKIRPEIVWRRNVCLRIIQHICAHQFFTYFGCLVAFANVLCIAVELSTAYSHDSPDNTGLAVANLTFIIYYGIEQFLKIWALGVRRYAFDRVNIFDGVITVFLVIMQGVFVAFYGLTFWGRHHLPNGEVSLWEIIRIINMGIILRLMRVTTEIKAMSVVVNTLIDLMRNLRAFAGILVVVFYSFAILGMELFNKKIKYRHSNRTEECGSYEQLEYWANNFDDFAASLVVLWDVMIVNNWHVFLKVYSKHTTKWSQFYFIAWWLISVVICLNLFTALILENFIMRWENQQKFRRERTDSAAGRASRALSVHDLFRENLQEPEDSELAAELRVHPHFRFAL